MMSKRLYWAIVTLYFVLFLASLWLGIVNGYSSNMERLSQAISSLAIALAGFFILSRKEHNIIGWLFVGIAQGIVFWSFTNEYARYALLTQPGRLPLGLVFAWFSLWSWVIYVWLIFVFLPLLYPDGRFLSTRWRVVAWFGGANMLVMIAVFALSPGIIDGLEPTVNPLGIHNNLVLWQQLESLATVAFIPINLLATLSLILRFRRANAEQRAQIKWFLYVVMLLLLHAAYGISSEIGLVPELPFGIGSFLFSLLMAAFAFALAVAILKYRLYDIDVIIRRTLQYTLLTGLLALVYGGSVVALQSLLVAITGQRSQVVIVISTLGIAALFNPLRQRVQAFIDRRFYRKKYDAQQVLAQFAQTARDEVEMEALQAELLRVVQETMQPQLVTFWVKEVK